MDLKCLFAESKNNMIDVTEEGNSIYLQNSTIGYTLIDEIKGNTLVNCNKEPDKEIILNGNINTQGYSNVTLTEGVDGGLVDVALEGNTMVNVCDQKDPIAITKNYTVETGNHVALQGEYDGKCRPVITGNTLWIDNATGEVLTAFDESKNLRLQSSFEDKVVTQEMVDNGEELAENLGKYKVDYVVTGKNKFNPIALKDCPIVSINNNGSVTLNGTLNRLWQFTFKICKGTYRATQTDATTENIYTIHAFWKGSDSSFHQNNYFTIEEDTIIIGYIAKGTYENFTVSLQVEEGTEATPYEPYKEYKKTFYLNSPLLEGDTIEQQGDNVVHVHRSEIRAYQTGDELTSPTDMTNTLVAKASPQYEVISQNDTILCDSYVNGHLDVDSVVPVEKVLFNNRPPFVLKYLYQNTPYIVQFESDNMGKIDAIRLADALIKDINIVKGINKFTLTTADLSSFNNALYINGIGFNASNIVVTQATDQDFGYFEGMKSVGECEDLEVVSSNSDGTLSNTQTLTHEPLRAVGDIKDKYVLIDGKWYIERNCGVRAYQEGDINNYITDKINTVYQLQTPTYEPIDYNPFTVYSDTTHISNNSTIPANMTIKNTGYNCLLKPSTTYTVSSNLGLNTVTTPAKLTEDCLRFMDTDTSTVTTMKDVTILEGDYTTGKPMPSHFSGIESAFEQEYDEVVGKYKVKARVQNEDASKENYIEFYIDEPLRGIRDAKDKIYIKDNKVVVERNCGSITLDGSDDEKLIKLSADYSGINNISFALDNVNNISPAWSNSKAILSSTLPSIADNTWKGKQEGITSDGARIIICLNRAKLKTQDLAGFKQYLQQNPTTVVYQLATPTYEEVEYNDVKLFIESFKNSTLFYNSNIPVTSKVHYSYSVPIVDTVSQTANVTDQQDSMIIDLATQCAVMEMYLM